MWWRERNEVGVGNERGCIEQRHLRVRERESLVEGRERMVRVEDV